MKYVLLFLESALILRYTYIVFFSEIWQFYFFLYSDTSANEWPC
jgi:hypothetical protein